MKVLVVGKAGNVTFWMENVVAAFRAEGYDTAAFSTTGNHILARLELSLVKRLDKGVFRAAIARQFKRVMTAFRPDLMVFTHAFEVVPLEVYQVTQELRRRPLIIGWVGDRFNADQIAKARCLDHLFFTDTGFIDDARAYEFPAKFSYLPHAANPGLFRPGIDPQVNDMVFVANHTPHRGEIVSALASPIAIYGRGWERMNNRLHTIHNHLINIRRVAKLYGTHRAVLNVMNEMNVKHGLNQRNFEPLACKSVLLTEQARDLELCFEPGTEILAYKDADELNDLYNRVRQDVSFAQRIAEAGFRRLMAEHTYTHRIQAMVRCI
jgi:spore maturation protein CgeB